MKSLFFAVFFLMLGAVCSALASPFTLGGGTLNLVLPRGSTHADVAVPILPASSPGFNFNLVSMSASVPWLSAVVDESRQCVVLSFATGALANGTFNTTLNVSHETDVGTIPLTVKVVDLNVTKLLDDPRRSRMYGIQGGGLSTGSVVVIDPVSAVITGTVTVGKCPTDLALSNDGSELFVLNSIDKTISVVSMVSLEVTETFVLPNFTHSDPSVERAAKVKVGPGNILYYTDAAWLPVLRVYDRATKQVLQSVVVDSTVGMGHFAVNSAKTKLYGWTQSGWSEGALTSYLVWYDVSPTGTLTLSASSTNKSQLLSAPLNTPVLVSHDDQEVFVKDVRLGAGSVDLVKNVFERNVYSISPGGEVAVSDTAIYEMDAGAKVRDLPVATSVHAFSSDYHGLVYFNPVTKGIAKLSLSELPNAESLLGRVLTPAEGAATLAPKKLSWASMSGAERYRVYFGTSESGPTEAVLDYLGDTFVPTMAVPEGLLPGTTYYWCVDTVVAGTVHEGAVHSFHVSPVSAAVNTVAVATMQGHADCRVSVPLSSAGAVSWSAVADKPWVTFSSTTGTSPGTLEVRLNAQALPVGLQRAVITLSGDGGALFTLPVELRVDPMAMRHLRADPLSGMTLGVSEVVPKYGHQRAYLVELDTATEALLKVVPVGDTVTDMCLHNPENRVYLTNWRRKRLLAFDKASLALVKEHTLGAMGEMRANDVYGVAAGKAGQVMVVASPYFSQTSLYDTVNERTLATRTLSEGSGVYDPAGEFYFYGDYGSTGSSVQKFDVRANTFNRVAKSRDIQYGSRHLVSSVDGKVLFWNKAVFDDNLVEKWMMPELVYSTTANGRLAFGEQKIYDAASTQEILTMPVVTKVSAYHEGTQKLVVQEGARLRTYPISQPVLLPAPVQTVSADADEPRLTISWTGDAQAQAYRLQYRALGNTAAGPVEWTTVDPAPQAGQTSVTLSGLIPAATYETRVQVAGAVSNSPWSSVVTTRTAQGSAPIITIDSVQAAGGVLQIKFTAINSPESVIVERATSLNGVWSQLGTLWRRGDASYDDTAVNVGVTYYYRVTAVRWDSRFTSPVVSGVLSLPTLQLGVHTVADTKVLLQTGTSNGFFTYALERRVEPAGSWVELQQINQWSYLYTSQGLQPNTTYSYRTKVTYAGQPTVYSNVVRVTTLSLGPPAMPAGFRASAVSSTSVQLHWINGLTQTAYRLERADVRDMVWTHIYALTSTSKSHVDRTVVPGRAYYYRLVARNGQGESPAAMTDLVVVEDVGTVFNEDFDPGLQAELWAHISSSAATVINSDFFYGNCLLVSGAGSVETRGLNLPAGGALAFSIRAGNERNDGAPWKNAEVGERVVVEFSTNGAQWTTLRSFDLVYPALSLWERHVIKLPSAARSVRWRHESTTEASGGAWALENVQIGTSIEPPKITQQPSSKLLVSGESATLTVAVEKQNEVTFQWYKDDAAIPQATQASYHIENVQPSDGARYKCVITYLWAPQETEEVYLAVVEKVTPSEIQVLLEGNFELELKVHPAELNRFTYSWDRKPVSGIYGIGFVSGFSSPKLEVTRATALAQSAYYCTVNYHHVESREIGPFYVKMLLPPVIAPISETSVVVGMDVDIPVGTSDAGASVTVTGLPQGLVYDAQTGRIHGRVMKPQTADISVQANNEYGTAAPVNFTLRVVPFPQPLVGTYRGVFMDGAAGFEHGGQVACQINKKGSVSGTVMLAGKTYRFVSAITEADGLGELAAFEASFKTKDGRALVLRLEMDLTAATFATAIYEGSGAVSEPLCTGVAVRHSAEAAASRVGLRNVALLPQVQATFPDPAAPGGVGFLNLTVNKKGVVTTKGRLADGQTVTGSTVMGLTGSMPIFVNLYRGTGSLAAVMEPDTVTGTARWGKDAQGEKAKDRVHKDGFARHSLTVKGDVYSRPVNAVSPLPGGTGERAYLRLTGAGLDPLQSLVQELTFNARQQAVLPKGAELNPHKFTLKLNAATGLYNGTFTLDDENPAKPGKRLSRKVSFYGCVAGTESLGFFLLPDLPEGKVTQTPIWSGAVKLLPVIVP